MLLLLSHNTTDVLITFYTTSIQTVISTTFIVTHNSAYISVASHISSINTIMSTLIRDIVPFCTNTTNIIFTCDITRIYTILNLDESR